MYNEQRCNVLVLITLSKFMRESQGRDFVKGIINQTVTEN
jgi:hypothetical protein